jgi:hypothetical protein
VLIIVEGPDGAGKTTLVERLYTRLRGDEYRRTPHRLHARPPKEHPLDEYETPLLGYHPGGDRDVICDRWHLGEAVYPAILRRPTQWDVAVSRHISAFLASRGALLVLLEPPDDVIDRTVTERGDDTVTADQAVAALSVYRRAIMRERLVRTLRFSREPLDGELDFIIQEAVREERRAHALTPFVTYVGPPTPPVLLLGDERNHAPHTLSPAFQPYPATSGHYLLRHLGVDDRTQQLGWANACDVDDVAELWRVLDRPRVVALGVNAARRLASLTVPHATVPHPQFIRRFHHRAGHAYVDAIVNAVLTGRSTPQWRP